MSKKEENEKLVNAKIKLLGLKMPYGDYFMSYFDKLPDYFQLCTDFRDFYKLKKGKRSFKKENYEKNVGMQFLVYSKKEDKYYYRILKEENDMNKLLKYFEQKLLYVFKDEIRQKVDFENPNSDIQPEEEDEDYLVF